MDVLDSEYARSQRLKTKFEWVNSRKHKTDRHAKRYKPTGKWDKQSKTAFTFLAAYAAERKLNLAPADLQALAIGLIRGISIVTDDVGMQDVAEAHQIDCIGILDLLKLMLDAGRIGQDTVAEVLQYLEHERDLPMPRKKLQSAYEETFGEDCPI